MECLWYVKFWYLWLKQEDKSIEWKTKRQAKVLTAEDKRSSVQQIRVLDMWVLQQAGWLANEMRVEIEIFKIFYKATSL